MSDWTESQKRSVIDAHKAGKQPKCPECGRPIFAKVEQFQPRHEGGDDQEVLLTCAPCGNPNGAVYRRRMKI